MTELGDRYPHDASVKDGNVELAILTDPAADDVKAFVESLDDHDLMFLSRDIREPKVLEAWKRSIAEGNIHSVVARRDGKVLGTTAVVTDEYSFSAHVGELRILVDPAARDIGLGRILIQESFLIGLDLGLEKLTVRMMLDQEAAISIFEEMGFKSEALFKDHVKDSAGAKHDLLMMSHDVMSFENLRQAYGMDLIFE